MTPLERAGSAAANIVGEDFETFRGIYIDVARAVLTAIREPSEGMWDAGDAVCDNNAIGAWQAMIDAALEEG